MTKVYVTKDTGSGRNQCCIQVGLVGTVLVGFGPEAPAGTHMREWAVYHLIEELAAARQECAELRSALEKTNEAGTLRKAAEDYWRDFAGWERTGHQVCKWLQDRAEALEGNPLRVVDAAGDLHRHARAADALRRAEVSARESRRASPKYRPGDYVLLSDIRSVEELNEISSALAAGSGFPRTAVLLNSMPRAEYVSLMVRPRGVCFARRSTYHMSGRSLNPADVLRDYRAATGWRAHAD